MINYVIFYCLFFFLFLFLACIAEISRFIMKYAFYIITLIVFGTLIQTGKADRENKNVNENLPVLIGIEYFNGWWAHSGNEDIHCFWETNNRDWRSAYPERIPILGEYSCQETMDKEILAASAYGIDFFSILWYFMKGEDSEKICRMLNDGVDFFMNSPNSGKMKFMVELANHEPNSVISDADWNKCIDLFIKAMKHPSYLRIDGRAVLKIHSGDMFIKDCGSSVNRSKEILEHLRQSARAEGAGEVLIAIGNYSAIPIDNNHIYSQIGEIDATMQYNSLPDVVKSDSDYPYEELTEEAKRIREIRKKDILNWIPYFPAGWNPRPWNDPRASFSLPTRMRWRTGLQELKADLMRYSNFGFPKKDGTTQKAFTIYAWNEYGEGGIMAPTVGDKYMKLEEIKNVFSK